MTDEVREKSDGEKLEKKVQLSPRPILTPDSGRVELDQGLWRRLMGKPPRGSLWVGNGIEELNRPHQREMSDHRNRRSGLTASKCSTSS